ncbi:FERM domain-containing protein 4B isoform X1 [Sphaerodactylus townsendi]|uniref:FERM domain-containing protein 4B isoform X1 n=2 Tax=Sphaerodactylus townsendi TaxID=933632 RepID=UPI002027018F|nr:FERM domain-containing protein 4B isoform X1 [Sphaerodactylus townsendi]XP_048345912.1 FERM domain-containing protein 4B isoform X1 [Sphaerodactylus townsendi]XP_048345913.1 FERM domain-containing protein 4B isoform X1 [Sphaerodactylus townsendi]
MTEGRHCQVQLLDDRKLELLVQPKLLSRELLDLVASHFSLKEKEYFGITFIDDTGQTIWLQLDHRVLEHDLPKKPGPVPLYFAVRFYIESISFLKDKTTVELFFLNAKACVHKGHIEVESETVFRLAALILQEAKGDYSSDENTRKDLKTLPVFPTKTLQEHPSLGYCEDRVIEHYVKIKGLTRGQAIVRYMKLVEALPTYGVHYYGVKDKQGIPWWLGISYKGIGQYDLQDKVKPRKLFQWKQLENLYFREKKFAVEVHDPRRISVSRRTFGQSGLVVRTWYANTSLIKSIWVMAISQHQFYLDRKQSKAKIPSVRSLDDIAMDLTEMGTPKVSKLATLEVKNPFITASNGSLISSGSQDSEVSEELKKEKIVELKKKEQLLQEKLLQKVEELKKICLREAELTGKMPREYPLNTGEKPPQVRRRVGTSFKLDGSLLPSEEDPALQDMENNFLIQQKLVEAAKKLAGEPDLCKNVKKKRKQGYTEAVKKLQEIENSINEYRIKCGKKPAPKSTPAITDDIIPSESSSLSDTTTCEDAGSDSLAVPGQRTNHMPFSPKSPPPKSLGVDRIHLRKSSMNEPFLESRHSRYWEGGHILDSSVYNRRDPLSTHSSPYRTVERHSHGGRSMPTTPVLTRNAYSSTHLQPDVSPQHFRQRRGSLESQTNLLSETSSEKPLFTISKSQRSSSTEILDDGSSYTSQSSTEYYCVAPNPCYTAQTLDNRTRNRRQSKKPNISTANSGSMPNLAPKDVRNGVYHKNQVQPPANSYISGYAPYVEYDVYCNGPYMYENGTEGQYTVNPSYRSSAHYGYERRYREFRSFHEDQMERVPHNPYATLRLPRKQSAKSEHITKNIHKALVAEHLRGWYQRASGQKDPALGLQVGFDDRGSQRSLGFAGLQVPCCPSSRASSFSSASSTNASGNWRNQIALSDYDTLSHSSYASSYGTMYGTHPLHSRTYAETSQLSSGDRNSLEGDLQGSEQRLFWHEDSKPGTLV